MYKGEWFNSISHLVGAALALAGLVVLVVLAARQGDPWKIVSFSVYGITLLLLYTFSTIYHGTQGRAKNIFRKFDHLFIYLLIAGSYTPFTLITLRGAWGWSIFGAVWGLAILGIVVDAIPQKGAARSTRYHLCCHGLDYFDCAKTFIAGVAVNGFLGAPDGRPVLYVWHHFLLAGCAYASFSRHLAFICHCGQPQPLFYSAILCRLNRFKRKIS